MQDPGNVGTMIRTADAAGFDGVFLSDKSADIYNMKVLRSTRESFPLASLSNADDCYFSALKAIRYKSWQQPL